MKLKLPVSGLPRGARLPALSILAVLLLASPGRPGEFLEDNAFFRVAIAGRTVRLEGLTVKRSDATGRLPVALITHGKAANLEGMLDKHATDLIGPARDLANRGWLAVVVMRRGFGQSDGPAPAPLTCGTKSFAERFSADADDLQATLDFIAERPDADPTRTIAIGVSAGGAAVIALASRNPKNLLGAINISGGLHMDACSTEDALVQDFKAMGTKSRIPTPWMYAKNDSLFGPELVGRMRDAFLDGGGDAKLVMFDPLGTDGHTALFSSGAGRLKWLPQMDAFLRVLRLPTWEGKDVDALMKKLNASEPQRGAVENYVAAPFEKALARNSADNTLLPSWIGAKTPEEARKGALDYCRKRNPQGQCTIVMEDDNWVASP